jgi:NAD(P)-dependent dehydrogenase (short-subunit alcohol dehydrogenase family)
MTNELTGTVAVVTGGASGLGRAIAEMFVAEGAHVVIADINREQGQSLAETLGAAALFKFCDVSEPAQIEDLVAFAIEQFGGLQTMVNNAGVAGPMVMRFLDEDLSDFHRVMSINLHAVMVGTQCAARHMAEHGGGSIINTTSIAGIQATRAQLTYSASKAGVIQFSNGAAIALGDHGVRVNCIAPGNIPTPMLRTARTDDLADDSREELFNLVRQIQRDMTPLNRQGTPEDVAQAAVYFASDRSRYVTGTVLRVDGGAATGNTTNPLARFAESAARAEP